MTADTITAIKKALEVDPNKAVTAIDRLRLLAGGQPDFDPLTAEDAEWIEDAMTSLLSTLESSQRENERVTALVSASEAERVRSCSELMVRAEAAAAEVKRLRAALEPFAKYAGDPTHIKQRAFLQLLICPLGDDHPDNHVPYFQAAKDVLASTGGEHNAE